MVLKVQIHLKKYFLNGEQYFWENITFSILSSGVGSIQIRFSGCSYSTLIRALIYKISLDHRFLSLFTSYQQKMSLRGGTSNTDEQIYQMQ